MPVRALPRVRLWGPVIVWAAVILVFSSSDFSSAQTQSWFASILALLFPGIEPGSLQTMHAILRKAAHVIEYAIFGALGCRAVRGSSPAATPSRSFFGAVALAVLLAAVDETHQMLLFERTGSVRDVAIDLAGAVIGGIATARWLRSQRP